MQKFNLSNNLGIDKYKYKLHVFFNSQHNLEGF